MGRVRVSCPPYGGLFNIAYKRSKMEIIESAATPKPTTDVSVTEQEDITNEGANEQRESKANSIVVRTTAALAKSETLSLPFSIPRNKGSSTIFTRGNSGRGGVVPIRPDADSPLGIAYTIPSAYDNLKFVVEDMRNISTLSVSIGPAEATATENTNQSLGKASAWFSCGALHRGIQTTAITVEVDLINSPLANKDCGDLVDSNLSYVVVPLPVQNGWELNWNESYGMIVEDKASSPENRIVLKIPYSRTASTVVEVGQCDYKENESKEVTNNYYQNVII